MVHTPHTLMSCMNLTRARLFFFLFACTLSFLEEQVVQFGGCNAYASFPLLNWLESLYSVGVHGSEGEKGLIVRAGWLSLVRDCGRPMGERFVSLPLTCHSDSLPPNLQLPGRSRLEETGRLSILSPTGIMGTGSLWWYDDPPGDSGRCLLLGLESLSDMGGKKFCLATHSLFRGILLLQPGKNSIGKSDSHHPLLDAARAIYLAFCLLFKKV
ncbi:hypothetical protein QBC44DRAFT_34939 [Cladorrhinum sp. PSN332]|nr:hypothetical protein QBC44DRAFT_34939 [Cladorrhinum sp. PSN332]